MELALAALPGVITTCLLIWVLMRVLARQDAQHRAYRTELAGLAASYSADLAAVHATHHEQALKLIDTHRREVANLCQRIQAPQIAVAEHVGQNTISDPPSVDISDDRALAAIAERERELDRLSADLFSRAETLAAEN